VTRTLNSNNALAIQTLSTSFKYPSRDGRLLNRIPKIPKRKLTHPPTALLSPAYTDLPDDPLGHAVAVDDVRTTGIQDIYPGKPF
jgi:hypothetical protein